MLSAKASRSAASAAEEMPCVLSNWLSWANNARILASTCAASRCSAVIGLLAFEQEQLIGPVMGQPMLWEEVRITRGHHTIGAQEPGGPMIGMQPPALPRVVPQQHVRAKLPDHPRHPAPQADACAELAVGLPQEAHIACDPQTPRCLALLLLAAGYECGGVGFRIQVPLEPSVHTRRLTAQPASAHLPSVAPQPNSMSSGVGAYGESPSRGRQVGGGHDRR